MIKRYLIVAAVSVILAVAATYVIDPSGNVSAPGNVSAGNSCSTCAGALDLPAGTDPGPSPNPNTFTLYGPPTGTPSQGWHLPPNAVGFLQNDGAGNLGWGTPSGGGGGGGGTTYTGYGTEFPVTDPTTILFAWHNQGGATETARTHALFLSAPSDGGTNTIRGREVTAGAPPYSVVIGIVPQITYNYNNVGLYATDGTKLITLAVTTPPNGGGMQVASFPSFNAGSGGSQIAMTNVQPVGLWYLKVLDDGTNLNWYWSVDGQDFTLIYSAGRTAFLSSVSAVGYYAGSHHATAPAGVLLVSFVTGNS